MEKIKILLASMLMVLISGTIGFAQPFLICDTPPAEEMVTSYIVALDGGAEIEVDAPLHYDLSGVAEGAHDVEIKAKNVWGTESPSAPFNFSKSLPSGTTGTTITAE